MAGARSVGWVYTNQLLLPLLCTVGAVPASTSPVSESPGRCLRQRGSGILSDPLTQPLQDGPGRFSDRTVRDTNPILSPQWAESRAGGNSASLLAAAGRQEGNGTEVE